MFSPGLVPGVWLGNPCLLFENQRFWFGNPGFWFGKPVFLVWKSSFFHGFSETNVFSEIKELSFSFPSDTKWVLIIGNESW